MIDIDSSIDWSDYAVGPKRLHPQTGFVPNFFLVSKATRKGGAKHQCREKKCAVHLSHDEPRPYGAGPSASIRRLDWNRNQRAAGAEITQIEAIQVTAEPMITPYSGSVYVANSA